jgi:hypothetical protein
MNILDKFRRKLFFLVTLSHDSRIKVRFFALLFQHVSTYSISMQELNLEKIGATVCIKYIDPANQRKGGRAEVTIANLKKLIPAAKSEKVCYCRA